MDSFYVHLGKTLMSLVGLKKRTVTCDVCEENYKEVSTIRFYGQEQLSGERLTMKVCLSCVNEGTPKRFDVVLTDGEIKRAIKRVKDKK